MTQVAVIITSLTSATIPSAFVAVADVDNAKQNFRASFF